MNWSEPVNFYCERASAAFWAEPVNALTNAGFLVAALAAFVEWRRAGGRDVPVLALIAVMVLIGLGSFAFHTLATRGAVYLDVIPIAVFIYGYLLLALVRFLHLRVIAAAAIVVAYAAGTQALSALAPPRLLNGSVGYLPALAALIAVALAAKEQGTRRSLRLAAAMFAISLAFRTADIELCPQFPLGIHFVWHILNAVVLYVLLRTAITARRAGSL